MTEFSGCANNPSLRSNLPLDAINSVKISPKSNSDLLNNVKRYPRLLPKTV